MAIRLSGLNSGMDTESIIQELVSAKSMKVTSLKKDKTKLSWKNDVWKELNTKIYSLYTNMVSKMRFNSAYIKKKTTVSDEGLISVTAGENAVNGVQTAHVEQLAKAGYLTGGKVTTDGSAASSTKLTDLGLSAGDEFSITSGGTTTTVSIGEETKISDVVSQLQAAGVNASFDEKQQRFFVSSKATGEENNFTFSGSADVLDKLGLETGERADGSGSTKIEGSDAVLVLNNARFTSDTNTFQINGTTYTVSNVSEKNTDGSFKETSIATTDDTDGIYDTIKNFFTEYNKLMNEMATLYNADSAKGYEPLTSEEKEALSDSEVADWEKKIKDSILRRDTTLGNAITTINSVMSAGVTMGDKQVFLSDFGIKTLGYFNADENERYAFHIDGDSADSSTSTSTDVLKSTIASDPEKVQNFFSALSQNLYTSMTSLMGNSDFSSMYKVYNDKQYESDLDNYDTKISDAEEKLTAYEDKWYSKFSSMETALAKLSSKQSAISGLFSS